MLNRRHFLATTVAGAVAMATAGVALADGKGLVGISMPTKSSTRWISDGESMVKEFKPNYILEKSGINVYR